jgi:hypothetical protein
VTGTLLAIDSGHPECAVAQVDDVRVVAVSMVGLGMKPGEFDRVVVEIPTVRPDTPNPEDLLLIAVAGSRLAERCAKNWRKVTEYRPTEWKGNTPKPPHHLRMWKALDARECALLGGHKTLAAIKAACLRGAKDRWQMKGALYYRARELPKVNGQKITHDILDAAALALYALGRISRG